MTANDFRANHPSPSAGCCPFWKRIGFALLLGLLAPALLPAQLSVTASLSQPEILIGDQLLLNIQVYSEGDAVVESVGHERLTTEVPALELLQLERFERDNGGQGKLLEYQLRLTAFDSGYYRLPPLPVVYRHAGRRDTAYTPELALLVKTLPIPEGDQQLMPIKDIIGEPLSFFDLLPWLVGLAILAIVVWMLLSLRRKKTPPPAPPPLLKPAHELALAELEQLEQQKLWQKGLIKEYYVRLTHALRQYLEWRYRVAALELTTEEAVRELGQAGLKGEAQQRLRRLLESADLVKFAKAQPAASFHAEALEQARAFIAQTQDEACLVDAQQYAAGAIALTPAASGNTSPPQKP
jgi:hypothetical protein